MPLTHTTSLRLPHTAEPILTEPHCRPQHGQRTRILSGTADVRMWCTRSARVPLQRQQRAAFVPISHLSQKVPGWLVDANPPSQSV